MAPPNKYQYIVSLLMKDTGMTYQQAIGCVGSLMQESSTNLNTSQLGTADNKGSYGIAQWHSSRLSGLKEFARKKGENWTNFYIQAQYVVHELKTTHKNALSRIKNSKDVYSAAENFTNHYERPHSSATFHQKRANYGMMLHNYLTKNNLRPTSNINYNTGTMANISDPKNPNFEAAQAMPKAQRDAITQIYKQKVRELSKLPNGKELVNEYNKELYQKGYIGFDSSGNAKGFLAEGINSQMSRNSKKAQNDAKIKEIALQTIGKVLRENTSARAGGNSLDVNMDQNAVSLFSKALSDIAKLDPKDATVRKTLAGIMKDLQSPDRNIQFRGLDASQRLFSAYTGKKADMFRKEKKGNEMHITPGKDVDYKVNDYFTFTPQASKKGFDAVTPVVQKTNFNDITMPNYDPVGYDGYSMDSTVPGIDGTGINMGMGDMPMSTTSVPSVDNLNYYTPDMSAPNNKATNLEYEKLRQKGAEDEYKRKLEQDKLSQEQLQKQKNEEAISIGQAVANQEPVNQFSQNVDPTKIKREIPVDAIAKLGQGVAGAIIGKDMMDEPLPERDERINNALLSYIYEQKRIADIGMNPSDEAAAKNAMADAYQMGIQNIERAASGNRNLILGNLSNLDNINAKHMMALSVEDAKMKQNAMESYGKAMEYVNNFEAQKSIANNERKYQEAVLKNSQGQAVFAGAFKSISDAIGSYSAETPTERLYKAQNDISIMGWSPLIEGDENTYGSKAWYDKNWQKGVDYAKKYDAFNKGISNLTDEQRNEFFLKHGKAGSTLDKQMLDFESQYGSLTETNTMTSNTLDENGNVIDQKVEQSKATVPMSATQVQNADGSTTVVTPYSVKSTDGTSANASVSKDQPSLVLPNKTMAPGFEKEKPIELKTFGTADGKTITSDSNQLAPKENGKSLNGSLAYAMGWQEQMSEEERRKLMLSMEDDNQIV